MTKKIFLIPLLAAPLVLAGCGNNAPTEPAAFDRGDNILSAELYREAIPAYPSAGLSLSTTQLTKEMKDAEGNDVWVEADADYPVAAFVGFKLLKKSVTVEAVTNVTYEAYNKATLDLVASWTETDDATATERMSADFSYILRDSDSGAFLIGQLRLVKSVYVEEESILVLDHRDYVDYDSFGHKLAESNDEYPASFRTEVSAVDGAAEAKETVLIVANWKKDHYEESRFVYSDGFKKLAPEKASDEYFESAVQHLQILGADYTMVNGNDAIEVYKDGVEAAVCRIEYSTLDAAIGYAFFETNVVYVLHKEVPNDAKEYTFIRHNNYGAELKTKQEIHSVNLLTGEDKLIENKYAVLGIREFIATETAVYGYTRVESIREDKTLEPTSEHYYVVDSKLVLHDDITYSPFVSGDDIFRLKNNYYDADEDLLLDANLNPIGYFDSDLTIQGVFGDKLLVSNETGNYALFDENGEMLIPFSFRPAGMPAVATLEVSDGHGTRGILDFDKAKITWFDMDFVEGDTFTYVKHNVAPEGEPEEWHYVTYFAGQNLGDFAYKLSSKIDPADQGYLYGIMGTYYSDTFGMYMVATVEEASTTDLSVSTTWTSYVAIAVLP